MIVRSLAPTFGRHNLEDFSAHGLHRDRKNGSDKETRNPRFPRRPTRHRDRRPGGLKNATPASRQSHVCKFISSSTGAGAAGTAICKTPDHSGDAISSPAIATAPWHAGEPESDPPKQWLAQNTPGGVSAFALRNPFAAPDVFPSVSPQANSDLHHRRTSKAKR